MEGIIVRMLMTVCGLVLVIMLVLVVACRARPEDRMPKASAQVVVLADADVEIYTVFGRDSAVLGLAIVRKGDRRPEYYPLYGSTYRGLPDCKVTVFIPEDTKKVWIESSWVGYEMLGYYDMDKNVCITRYGVQIPCDGPMPDSLGDGPRPRIPDIGRGQSGKRVTVHLSDRGRRLEVE